NDGGNSYGVAWGDYDNDGFIDLFVANGGEENDFLYHNDGDGLFTKILLMMLDGHNLVHGATMIMMVI
ncbi:FG-GAP-like repeat-containing protein, partial [Bacteroidota bacterium]